MQGCHVDTWLQLAACVLTYLNHNSHPTHSASQAWTHTADHQHRELNAPDLSPKEEESSSPVTSRSHTQVGNSKQQPPNNITAQAFPLAEKQKPWEAGLSPCFPASRPLRGFPTVV